MYRLKCGEKNVKCKCGNNMFLYILFFKRLGNIVKMLLLYDIDIEMCYYYVSCMILFLNVLNDIVCFKDEIVCFSFFVLGELWI